MTNHRARRVRSAAAFRLTGVARLASALATALATASTGALAGCTATTNIYTDAAGLMDVQAAPSPVITQPNDATYPDAVLAAVRGITAPDLVDTIEHLASDHMNGRHWKSVEGFMAAGWIAGRMHALGLEPCAADGTWFDPLAGHDDASPNVMGRIRGTGDGIVLVGGHYDHLRRATDKPAGADVIYNGADDNASGISAMLAVAEALLKVHAGTPLKSTVIFVGFSGEESGLRGSRDIAANPPFDLDQMRGLYNMDMISRGKENLICVDGPIRSPRLAAALRRANTVVGLDFSWDEHPDWLPRSDQAPFLAKDRQAVLFSVEDHEDYHQVTDHADKVLPKLVERTTRLVALAAWDVAMDDGPVAPAVKDPRPQRRRRGGEGEEHDARGDHDHDHGDDHVHR
ncbi:MAG: M28 family peptidase [Phycisphaerales bacterium]